MSNTLVESQEKAIKKTSGPCIILAGAGTGKTFTIVQKIKQLVKNKIYSPEKIVCITFSNEAANNLLSKIRNQLNENEDGMTIKTFHAFSSSILKQYGEKIGIDKSFSILDPDEAKILLYTQLNVAPENCQKYINAISTAKDLGIPLKEVESYSQKKESRSIAELKEKYETVQFELHTKKTDVKEKKELQEELKKIKKNMELKKFVSAWSAYEKIKEKESQQDYADLNVNALKLLSTFPNLAEEYDYIIVDEFQDTNKIQLELLFHLAKKRNITVVGDLNQSIYRFRGAYKENFSLFKEHFNVRTEDIITLDKSFRSPNKILNAAHQLILNNYSNAHEAFQVKNAHSRIGAPIEIFEMLNQTEEARKVSEIIEQEINQEKKYEEICVMCRTHAQSDIIKKVLEQKDILFNASSKKSLLAQKEIKKIISYLKLIHATRSSAPLQLYEWWQIFHEYALPQPDLVTIGAIIKKYREKLSEEKEFLKDISEAPLTDEGKIKIKTIISAIQKISQETEKTIPELLTKIYSVCISPESNPVNTILNANKFYELANNYSQKKHSSLSAFFSYLDALQRLDIHIDAVEENIKGVRLMTMHATKGLEYPIIIITNCAEGRFPIERPNTNSLIPLELFPEIKENIKNMNETQKEEYIAAHDKTNQMNEERRLCYVAFTRAKEKLYCTYAQQYGERNARPSRFLDEINYTKNNDVIFLTDAEKKWKAIQDNSTAPSPKLELVPADEHPTIKIANHVFSPSSLLTFKECQKKFEYVYVYNMPEKKPISWEAIQFGSLLHKVLEQGVKEKVKNAKQFIDIAKELCEKEEWKSVDVNEISNTIKIFHERNKEKINNRSLTEQSLFLTIGGVRFFGKADRIDFTDDGIEIVDYKTGKTAVSPLHRNWQLGYYALAAEQKFGRVKKVTLDMLRQEKPLEFEIDDEGNAIEISSKRMSFNIHQIKKELIATTQDIMQAYHKGFQPCPIEKSCEFCNEYVYKLK